MIQDILKKINRWSFDKKMQFLIRGTVMFSVVLALVITTTSSVTTLKDQAINLLYEQNATIENNLRNSLENYKSIAIATVLDDSIQDYMKNTDIEKKEILSDDAYGFLSSVANMYADLNFIAITNDRTNSYLYRGRYTISHTSFPQVYSLDYLKCKNIQDNVLKMNFNNAYYDGKKYSVTVYYPVFDTEYIFRELGLLCINYTNSNLESITMEENEDNIRTTIVDVDGVLFAGNDDVEIGGYVNYIHELRNEKDSFIKDGKIYIAQKMKNWNLYVVSQTSLISFYSSSIKVVFLMLLLLIIILLATGRITKYIIIKAYKPLDEVIGYMDHISAGTLDQRIDEKDMGEDFAKLAVGFNSMMEQIVVLMEQVKMEQHQIEQIRFNALQSQIQPHFLYNTLECIHWQAMVDGNKEISTLVKALAKYYRICLSKGHDVISLEMEMEHIKNYLIIQNMRYDNIIGLVMDIDSEINDVLLPKLTLQPLVENAIYHGMKVQEGKKGTIFITAAKKEEQILITVYDTGTGMTDRQIEEMNQNISKHEESFGYGVRNVNKRIELLYGNEYGLNYLKNASGGVTVEILLPYVTKIEENVNV